MFVLVTRKETVRVPPGSLRSNGPLARIVEAEVNTQYCNRVVPGEGLAIAVWDLVHLGEPLLFAGESSICIDGTCIDDF